jgi:hypothetical protein
MPIFINTFLDRIAVVSHRITVVARAYVLGYRAASQGAAMKIAILTFDGMTALDAVGPAQVLAFLPGASLHWV